MLPATTAVGHLPGCARVGDEAVAEGRGKKKGASCSGEVKELRAPECHPVQLPPGAGVWAPRLVGE